MVVAQTLSGQNQTLRMPLLDLNHLLPTQLAGTFRARVHALFDLYGMQGLRDSKVLIFTYSIYIVMPACHLGVELGLESGASLTVTEKGRQVRFVLSLDQSALTEKDE